LNTIVTEILAGKFNDSELAGINAAIKYFRASEARKMFNSLIPGDKVRFVTEARPAYLAGATGQVRELRRTKIVIDLDKPCGRYSRGIVTPPALVERCARAGGAP